MKAETRRHVFRNEPPHVLQYRVSGCMRKIVTDKIECDIGVAQSDRRCRIDPFDHAFPRLQSPYVTDRPCAPYFTIPRQLGTITNRQRYYSNRLIKTVTFGGLFCEVSARTEQSISRSDAEGLHLCGDNE